MDEISTRQVKTCDFNKIKKIEYLFERNDDNILDYLHISEDGRYIIYSKKEKTKYNDVHIGHKIEFFVYDSKRKEFLEGGFISERRATVDRYTGDICVHAYRNGARYIEHYRFLIKEKRREHIY